MQIKELGGCENLEGEWAWPGLREDKQNGTADWGASGIIFYINDIDAGTRVRRHKSLVSLFPCRAGSPDYSTPHRAGLGGVNGQGGGCGPGCGGGDGRRRARPYSGAFKNTFNTTLAQSTGGPRPMPARRGLFAILGDAGSRAVERPDPKPRYSN